MNLKKIALIGFGVLIVCVVIYFFQRLYTPLIPSFLTVRVTTCKTQFGQCAEEDTFPIKKYEGKSLFFLNRRALNQELEKNFKNEYAYNHLYFPNTLDVYIKKRKAVVGITKTATQKIYLVSKEGVVLEEVESTALPLLILGEEFEIPPIGNIVKDKEIVGIEILNYVYKIWSQPHAKIESNKFLVKINETLVTFPLDREPSIVIGALQLILTRSKIDSKLVKTIDLRYKKPILTY